MTASLLAWGWVAVVFGYLAFHVGHGHANYRAVRAAGGSHGLGLYWFARGPYVTFPIGGGFRLGRHM